MALNRNQKAVAAESWNVLNNPLANDVKLDDENFDPTELRERRMRNTLYSLRAERAITTLMNLTARKSAAKKSVEKLVAFMDARIKADDDDDAYVWKLRMSQMLIALDQPKQLERRLRQWIAQDKDTSHWRRTLARLVAEQGKFDEAIQLVRHNDQESVLTAGDHALLARWRMVLVDRAGYERSRIETWKAMEEWRISNWISQQTSPWRGYNNQPVPEELDENVIFAFRALFEKSASLNSYMYNLREFYQLTRDFRLLRMVSDAAIGRTPEQVYPFLNAVRDRLLREVRNEAAADEIVVRIKELRETPNRTPIDARALDLLECMVESRSTEVLNQPGPHADAALAALKRAYKHDIADGEIPLMSWFLSELSRLRQQDLADEQVRQLRDLHSKTDSGTEDNLNVSWHLSRTLFSFYDRKEEGLAVMEAAVRAYEQLHPDGWTSAANTAIDGYVGFLEQSGQFKSGEEFVRKHIAIALNDGQRHWFKRRLQQMCRAALNSKASMSFGRGSTLLQKTVEMMLRQVDEERNDSFTYATLNYAPQVFATAIRENVAQTKLQFRTYAFEQLPTVLPLLKNNYENVIRSTADSLKRDVSMKTSLEFLITRVEKYPDRFKYSYQSGWRSFGHRLGDWRRLLAEQRVGISELEPRLLAIVLKELKRDMRTRNSYSRYIYGRSGYRQFWSAKSAAFRKAAEEVLAKRKDSLRTAKHVAQYLRGDLGAKSRPIEILFGFHKNGRLDENGQNTLVSWLQQDNRYGETISIMEPLVKLRPDRMSYRVDLILAYAKTNRPNQTRELITATDKHFRADGRWTEHNMFTFADCLYELGESKLVIPLFNELIPRYQRSLPNGGLRNYSLSQVYRHLAMSHSRLRQTKLAVDAASSAVLLWNRTDSNRNTQMSTLQSVLDSAADLEEYIKDHLDKQAEETGQDSPIIRRMCGVALLRDNKPQQAVEQFKLALELDPMNAASRTELIKLYEGRLKKPSEAIALRLEQLNIERHNLDLYVQLSQRTKDDDALAERALTSIVESAPTEHTHHQKMAELRQGQNRWEDAIVHWQQVAKHQSFEPTGLLGLVEAQIRAKHWDDARRTVTELKNKDWPSRFSSVESKVRGFENRLQSASDKRQ